MNIPMDLRGAWASRGISRYVIRKGLLLGLAVCSLFALRMRAQDQVGYKHIEDVIYGRKFGTALTLDVFEPANANGHGVVFLVSGGWFSSHDNPPNYHAPYVNPEWIRLFLVRGYTVFTVVHGSQPKFIIPEIVQDLLRAVRFIRHNGKIYGVDPGHLGITGSSSGGHLALMVATQGGDGNAEASDPVDRESSAVQAAGVFFPPTDFLNWGGPGIDAVGMNTMAPLKAAFGPRSDTAADRLVYGREISPAYFVTANLPPVVIIHGDLDPTVPIQQSELFIKKAQEAGATLPKLVIRHGKAHGWKDFWDSEEDIKVFTDWFDRYLRGLPDSGTDSPSKPSP